jgi:hypothetical protein
MLCKIGGFHSSDYEECRLLGCSAVVSSTAQGLNRPHIHWSSRVLSQGVKRPGHEAVTPTTSNDIKKTCTHPYVFIGQ